MTSLDLAVIEQRAQQLRAEELHRIQGLISARLSVYGDLLGASLLAATTNLGKSLRTLFSWNPQARHPS